MSAIQSRIYVVWYCPDNGQMQLCSIVPIVYAMSTFDRISLCYMKKEKVWIYGIKRQVKIDDVVPQRVTKKSVLALYSIKNMIICAFSTPERALACLNIWHETKGQQNLSAE